MHDSLDPEVNLLLLCARTKRDSLSFSHLQTLAQSPLDWERLYQLARDHRVTPLLFKTLSTKVPEDVPSPILKRLQASVHAHMRHALLLSHYLKKLVQLFAEHDISTTVFKGPVTATRSYGSLSHRLFSDLDILIDRRHVHAAVDLLHQEGFKPINPLPTQLTGTYILPTQEPQGNANGYKLDLGTSQVRVDLHWALTARYFSCAIDLDDMLSRRVTVNCGGTQISTFTPEDSLLFLCAHGSKHQWECLYHICDVAELIRSHPSLKWSRVIERARSAEIVQMLTLGLRLANSLLGASIPAAVFRELPLQQSKPLYKFVLQKLFKPSSLKLFSSWKYHLLLAEHLKNGLRASLYHTVLALQPTAEDKKAVSLPTHLSFLYYLVHPARRFLAYIDTSRRSVR